MSNVVVFEPGGYRFIEHAFQYSGGVAAEPGFAIERARFAQMPPLAEGFDAVEAHLKSRGRPPAAFCACELRSPAQFTDAGFVAFNRHYVQRLERWGIFRDDVNPVARTNVCPEIDPPAAPSFYAFCYTVPAGSGHARTDFVAAGSGEAVDTQITTQLDAGVSARNVEEPGAISVANLDVLDRRRLPGRKIGRLRSCDAGQNRRRSQEKLFR